MAVSARIFVYSLAQGKRERQCKAGGFADSLSGRVMVGLAALARARGAGTSPAPPHRPLDECDRAAAPGTRSRGSARRVFLANG